jgi:hypothetical protein
VASDGTGRDESGLLVALGAGQRGLDAALEGSTGLSVRENGGAKYQDGLHARESVSDYP